MIYFDNSATSFYKPKECLEQLNLAVTQLNVNPNRSFNILTQTLSEKIFATRQKIAKLVNCPLPQNVVFGMNCTDALNLAIFGSVKKRGRHVITTVFEHNSVLRPLNALQRNGHIQLTVLQADKNMQISPRTLENAILPNTSMVVVNHVSNVLGATQNLASLGEVCRKNGLVFIVDASQSIGYLPIDMKKLGINLLAFPAHKGLHGIAGCGALCFDENNPPNPIKFGGTGTQSHLLTQPTESPEAYESGTLNSPAILALGGALDWLKKEGKDFLGKIELLQSMLVEKLKEVKKVRIRSLPNHSGIVTFDVINHDSQEISDLLAENYGIATRGGLHCAPLCHSFLGTEKSGLVRVSLGGDNSTDEVFAFIDAIKEITEKY